MKINKTNYVKQLLIILSDAIKYCNELPDDKRFSLMEITDILFRVECKEVLLNENALEKITDLLLNNDVHLFRFPTGTTEVFLQEDLGLSDGEVSKYHSKAIKQLERENVAYKKWKEKNKGIFV